MKRATYRPHELRAGMTVFFAGVDYTTPDLAPDLAEFLISDSGPEPKEGERLPYRISRDIASRLASSFPMYRTRRGAWRAAKAEEAEARERIWPTA